jgi:hypothetical protein
MNGYMLRVWVVLILGCVSVAEDASRISLGTGRVVLLRRNSLTAGTISRKAGTDKNWKVRPTPVSFRMDPSFGAHDPNRRFSSVCVDGSRILALEDGVPRLLEIGVSGDTRVLYQGGPLIRPVDVACRDGRVYISDADARALFSLDVGRGALIQEFVAPPSAPFPNRIVATPDSLIGIDTKAKVVFQFFEISKNLSDVLDAALKTSGSSAPPLTLRGGEQISLLSFVSDIADFAVYKNTLYLSDTESQRLVLIPLLGGEIATWSSSPILGRGPIAMSVDQSGIYFLLQDGNLARIPLLVATTLRFQGGLPSESIVSFYHYLRSRDLLRGRPYLVRPNDNLASIVVKEGVLPTGYVESFAHLFCEINPPSLCKGGKPRVFRGNEAIVLPDVPVATFISRLRVVLPNKTSDPRLARHPNGPLGAIAREFVLGDTNRESIDGYLRQFNPSYRDDPSLATKGTFLIPIEAARIQAAVPLVDVDSPKSELSAILSKQVNLDRVPTVATRSLSREPNVILSELGPPGQAPAHQETGCLPVDQRFWKDALPLIDYCIPTRFAGLTPVEVAIVDYHFDGGHPEFNDDLHQEHRLQVVSPDDPSGFSRKTVGTVGMPSFDQRWDHGTHVAGLVGASGRGGEVVGVNPQALIYGVLVGNFRNTVSDSSPYVTEYLLSLGEKNGDKGGALPGYDSTRDIAATIKDPNNNGILFVIAAGEDGHPVQPDSLASNGSLSNVITVGATDLNGIKLGLSSPDPTLVNIMAPGSDLDSSVFQSAYAKASGTSQAAALVAGAAALLREGQRSWEPWKVKQRLLSAADLWGEGLADDARLTFSGMLNIRRAVTHEDAAVVNFDEEEGKTECVGIVSGRSRFKQFLIKQPPGTAAEQIAFADIRRFKRLKSANGTPEDRFTLIYSIRDHGSSAPRLTRETVFRNQLQNTTFLFDPGPSCPNVKQIDLTQVSDFLNGFYF